MLGDHALLSISNRLGKENNDVFSPACLPDVPAADTSSSQSLFQWLNNSNTDKLEMSKVSEHSGGSHLENDLLYQQCRDLHEELSQKDRDLNVLGDEVAKSAEELEEARSRLVHYISFFLIVSSFSLLLMISHWTHFNSCLHLNFIVACNHKIKSSV